MFSVSLPKAVRLLLPRKVWLAKAPTCTITLFALISHFPRTWYFDCRWSSAAGHKLTKSLERGRDGCKAIGVANYPDSGPLARTHVQLKLCMYWVDGPCWPTGACPGLPGHLLKREIRARFEENQQNCLISITNVREPRHQWLLHWFSFSSWEAKRPNVSSSQGRYCNLINLSCINSLYEQPNLAQGKNFAKVSSCLVWAVCHWIRTYLLARNPLEKGLRSSITALELR